MARRATLRGVSRERPDGEGAAGWDGVAVVSLARGVTVRRSSWAELALHV